MENRLEYWKGRWESKESPWHSSCVNTFLRDHFHRLSTDGSPMRFFVPLCGKTLDMKWLYELGHNVIGVDGVEDAILAFFEENEIQHRKEVVDGIACFTTSDGRLRVYHADFLDTNPSIFGRFDAIWDRGSLVAIYAHDRAKYAGLMKQVFSNPCSYLIDTMVYDQSTFAGPPRSVPVDEIKTLFGDCCAVETLQIVDRNGDTLSNKNAKIRYGLDECYEIILLLTHCGSSNNTQ